MCESVRQKLGHTNCCPSFTKKDECSEFIFELLEIDWGGAISSQCIFAKKVVSAESIIFAETSKFETWRYESIHLNPLIAMGFLKMCDCTVFLDGITNGKERACDLISCLYPLKSNGNIHEQTHQLELVI